MVLTRSMRKEVGLRPIISENKPTYYRKRPEKVEKFEEVKKVEKQEEEEEVEKQEEEEEVEEQEEEEEVENKFALLEKYPSFPEYSSWQYYALFTTAFMLCVWQKSALGLVGFSILSQVVHWILTNKKF